MTVIEELKSIGVDLNNLSLSGSMNIIVNLATNEESPDEIEVFNYMPRRQSIDSFITTREEILPRVKESIDRLKIIAHLLQKWVDGDIQTVYYPEIGDERYDDKGYLAWK